VNWGCSMPMPIADKYKHRSTYCRQLRQGCRIQIINKEYKAGLPVSVAGLFTLQRTNTENSKNIFPENELCGHGPNFTFTCL
jgi:hypothetical protein